MSNLRERELGKVPEDKEGEGIRKGREAQSGMVKVI